MKFQLIEPTELPEDSLDESLKLLRRVTVRPQRIFLADFLELAEKDFIEGWEDQENGLKDEGRTRRSDAYEEGYYRCLKYYDLIEERLNEN
tara:strand:+ start:457 stop:729 length:273 start_codon:yes stop_codon:yes gene_type:complete